MKKKIKTNEYSQDHNLNQLSYIFSKMDKEEDIDRFLTDLCTPAELIAMADRLRVATEIFTGKSYREIYEETGVSMTTIGRVARCIHYGNGGYQCIQDLLRETHDKP